MLLTLGLKSQIRFNTTGRCAVVCMREEEIAREKFMTASK